MALFIAAILFFFIGHIETHAQSGWEYLDNSPERLVGLLDLPDIVAGGCGTPDKRATTPAFGEASQNAPVVGTIYMRDEGDAGCGLMIERTGSVKEEIPTMESGYEIPAAMVYERRGQWLRIRLKIGSAWIRRSDAEAFLPYPEMLDEKLGYIPQGWDGVLRETPGTAGKVKPLTPGWKALLDRGLSIQYLGSQRVGNDLWVHIRLAAKAACGQTYEGVTDVEGWIPAYRSNRSPALWFSSRGC